MSRNTHVKMFIILFLFAIVLEANSKCCQTKHRLLFWVVDTPIVSNVIAMKNLVKIFFKKKWNSAKRHEKKCYIFSIDARKEDK